MSMKVTHYNKYIPQVATAPEPEFRNKAWNQAQKQSLKQSTYSGLVQVSQATRTATDLRVCEYRSTCTTEFGLCVLQHSCSTSYLSQKLCPLQCRSSSGLGLLSLCMISQAWMMEHSLSTRWLALVFLEKLIGSCFFFLFLKITVMGKTLTCLWYCSTFPNF